jgi:hypothetical protein
MIARFTTITLALLVAIQADTLRLRNGAAVTGTWLGGTSDEVRLAWTTGCRGIRERT